MIKKMIEKFFWGLLLIMITEVGQAKIRKAHSLGVLLSLTAPQQKDVNSWVSSLGQVGTKSLDGGYELIMDYHFRFQPTIFSILFRPSYLIQSASGGGITTSLSALSFFPLFRFYPLENNLIQFFMQIGVGYSKVNVSLQTASALGEYSNSAFGALGGIGINFCFTQNHCVTVEGNLRYLPIERLKGTANGSLGGNITQTSGELEMNNEDLGVTLSGVQGIIGYRINF